MGAFSISTFRMLIFDLYANAIPLGVSKVMGKLVLGIFWDSDTITMKINADAPQRAPTFHVNRIMDFQRAV